MSDNKNAVPSIKTEETPYLNRYSVIITIFAFLVGSIIVPIIQFLVGQSDPAITAAAKVNEFAVPDQQPVYVPPIRLLRIEDLEEEARQEPSRPGLKEEHNPLEELSTTLTKYRCYTTVSMRNAGDVPATNVRLQIGGDGLAEIEWDDGKKETTLFQTEIQLGAIPIEKSVTLSLWTTESFGENDSFLVIHDTGKDTLYLASGETDSVVWSLISGGVSVILGFTLAFIVLLVFRQVSEIFNLFSKLQLALTEGVEMQTSGRKSKPDPGSSESD